MGVKVLGISLEAKFAMNDILKDTVSGFKGQVLGITYYATGCIHYGLAPNKVKEDGTLHEWQWMDESRLVLVKKAAHASKVLDK